MDMGSYVVIVNAEKVIVSGDKANQKIYTRHTGRPGSRKEETFAKLQAVRSAAVAPLTACGGASRGSWREGFLPNTHVCALRVASDPT